MKKARKFLKKIIYIIGKPYMRVLPGQLAFFTVLSLVPLIAILGAILLYFDIDTTTNVFINISSFLPVDVSQIISNGIGGKGFSFNIFIFLLTAFFLASNGAHSIIITSNEIYGIKGRDYIRRRLKAIAITIILVFVIVFILVVPVFGELILDIIRNNVNDSNLMEIFSNIFKIINIPITMITVFFVVKLIYNLAPDVKNPKAQSNLGPIFTTVMWILSTELYSVYVRDFSHYNRFYGSISNVIILMIWVYYLSYVFVLGMAISATGDKELELTHKIDLEDINTEH